MKNTEKKYQLNDFIRQKIRTDLKENKNNGKVHTRFPPEPNGYLHIGHALSIWLNFGLAEEFNGKCNLRFDDTNPEKEEVEYVDSIKEDIKWLGYNWEDRLYYASDYFEQLYSYAVELIKKGKAYVDSLTADEIKKYRGTPTEPGKESPHRNRTVEENLNLFEKMRAGEFKDGEHILRAKIDMSSPNMNLRDPAIYRIKKATHHRTGDKWCIYPMYDFAHGQSDALEGITHSICTLEFENHRPLYDWLLDNLSVPCHPQQIEFARLNLSYTVMSKRKLLTLVQNKTVSGWDDPRMPTLSGFRRRGYTSEAIKNFVEKAGFAKRENVSDISLLEHCLREDLNYKALRVMAVLNPVKIIIENYPENKTEELDAINNPEDETMGKRKISFSREIFIEKEDFMEEPPKKFFRLSPGNEVRLRYAYIIKCVSVEKDKNTGDVKVINCVYDPETKSGMPQSSRKVKGTIHWINANDCVDAEVRLYDRLFTIEHPDKDKEKDFTEFLNPDSLIVLNNCKVEPSLKDSNPLDKLQFERRGYFCIDSKDSNKDKLVFNRTIPLRDSWAKISKQ
ncbi:MAG: glutamine--tRNA ligase [Ignavibacteriales bacterium CG_4_9_14_3_um_filter_30_11]|nr:MAG: glutamine--tRNA ligase [Ignavibacteriales bacterium CG_4_9_14_3_um_filter_30_11]